MVAIDISRAQLSLKSVLCFACALVVGPSPLSKLTLFTALRIMKAALTLPGTILQLGTRDGPRLLGVRLPPIQLFAFSAEW